MTIILIDKYGGKIVLKLKYMLLLIQAFNYIVNFLRLIPTVSLLYHLFVRYSLLQKLINFKFYKF